MKTKILLSSIIAAFGFLLVFNGCKKEEEPLPEAPTVTTAAITDITPFAAKSGGEVTDDGGAEVTQRGVVWGLEQNPDMNDYLGKTSDGAGSGAFESLLAELERGITYYVRAYAVNSEGVAYGNERSFATLAELATVSTAEAGEITHESAVSGGQVVDDGGTEVTGRGVVWSRQTHPSTEENDGMTEDGEGPGSFTSVLDGLKPETTYYVRAFAVNSEGTAYGDQVSFVTLADVKPPTVLTNPVTNITHNSAIAGGNVTESGGASVSERGVVYATSAGPALDDHVVTVRRGTGTFIAPLTGLQPQTSYYLRAYATNAAGTSYGEEVVFTTEKFTGEPCPGAPTVTDIDGNVYQTVLIGNQCWFKENLRTTHYSDGTPIPHVPEDDAWAELTGDGYTWYQDRTDYANAYGAIYNWHAVNTTLLCPPGWRVPADDDWLELADYLISHYGEIDENNVGNKLKSCRQSGSPLGNDCDTSEHPFWQAHDLHYGTDDFGFSALPAGSRNGFLGYFYGQEIIAYFWSATSYSQEEAYYRRIYNDSGALHRMTYFKENGYSVRCFRPK